jgi:hypothetical protein
MAENGETSPEEMEELSSGSAMMEFLAHRMMELEKAHQPTGAVSLPPAPPARKDRKHIMVWVNPYNQVRREVPDDYNGPEVVEAFKNYARSRLLGRRR